MQKHLAYGQVEKDLDQRPNPLPLPIHIIRSSLRVKYVGIRFVEPNITDKRVLIHALMSFYLAGVRSSMLW